MMMVIPRREGMVLAIHSSLMSTMVFVYFNINELLSWLTHTPYITSGHGWTLVNVGFTMAIAILDEKWVYG